MFAFSGLLKLRPGERARGLVDHAVGLAGDGPKRVCFIPTAVGDAREVIESVSALFTPSTEIDFSVLTLFTQPSVPDVRAHLLSQDVLLVGGGSVVNLMAVWQAHRLAHVMRECWDAGLVLAGWSAGSLCWHLGGPTDSFGDSLAPFTEGLGFVPYSNGVHDDLDDQPRRSTYREYVAQGVLPAGYTTEDGVGLHYIGTGLHEAVSVRDGARAWKVEPAPGGGFRDESITPRKI